MKILGGLCLAIALGTLSSCGSKSSDKKEGDMQPHIAIPVVPNKIQYESNVSAQRKEALNEAVSFIHKFPLSEKDSSSEKLMKLMKISDVHPETLQKWMEERVHVVIDEKTHPSSDLVYTDSTLAYPEADQLPNILEDEKLNMEKDDAQVMMSNMGVAAYLEGKVKKKLGKLILAGIGEIPVMSPRVGLLQIGAGLFADEGKNLQNVLLAAVRAKTLFHEARHSDGHGKTVGFLHTKCPSGHDYANMYACDASKNGPYMIGAEMLKGFLEACQYSCTELTKTALKVTYFDNLDRVLSKYQLPSDTREYKVGTDWDDTPESIVKPGETSGSSGRKNVQN